MNELEKRLKIIEKKQQKNKIEKFNKELDETNKNALYVEKIKNLNQRIDNLITIGNKCIESNINFPKVSWNNESFIVDGVSHCVGFYRVNNHIDYIGIKNGGAFGEWDLYVNKNDIFLKHEKTREINYNVDNYNLKRFLNRFKDFENDFYTWVDNLLK